MNPFAGKPDGVYEAKHRIYHATLMQFRVEGGRAVETRNTIPPGSEQWTGWDANKTILGYANNAKEYRKFYQEAHPIRLVGPEDDDYDLLNDFAY